QFGAEVARHLLLAGRKLVDALAYRRETKRYRFELLWIGRRRCRDSRVESGLCNGSLRSQPAQLRVGVPHALSGRAAVRQPGKGGTSTNEKREQNARERTSLAARWSLDRWLAGQQVCGKCRSCVAHRYLPPPVGFAQQATMV